MCFGPQIYKYSPTFALAFLPFAWVPVWIGALFYPRQVRTAFFMCAMIVVFTLLPPLVCSPRTLFAEYQSWSHLISRDHGNHGWSLMSVVQDGLRLSWPSACIQATAAAAQAVPLALGARFGTDPHWRLTFASRCATLRGVGLDDA